jgi:hypothetical protein
MYFTNNRKAWSQLGLQATLVESGLDEKYNGAHILMGLGYCGRDNESQKPPLHRLGLDVPFSDIKPPEGVISVSLQAVQLSVDIVGTITKPKSLEQRQDHLKKMRIGKELKSSREILSDSKVRTIRVDSAHDELDDLLFDDSSPVRGSMNDAVAQSRVDFSNLEERSEISDVLDAKIQEPNRGPSRPRGKRKRATTLFNLRLSPNDTRLASWDLKKLINAAMHFSVCASSLRSFLGVRAVASTFTISLSDICPSVWKPEHLRVGWPLLLILLLLLCRY